jgi:hypothetical protein
MSFNAIFYTFAKKQNSTAQPSGTGTTLSVELKENCSVVNPILRVYNTANFNPSDLNYCYINKFARYYWVEDWEYGVGEWLAHLRSDPLASFKAGIGSLSKYVLRSAYEENDDIIDDFYPTIAQQPDYLYDYGSLLFTDNMASGSFVLGVANNSAYSIGAITYYVLSYNDFANLVDIMLPESQTSWLTSFNGLTDTLYRSIYDPFSYIKSCKWFPFTIGSASTAGNSEVIRFGNYLARDINNTPVMGDPLRPETSYWYSGSEEVQLPTGWTALKARSRTLPFAHIYLVCNPWGVIELNPMDFTNTRDIKIYFYPDLISGDGFLKVYKKVGNTENFLLQRTAKVSIDIPLTASTVDLKSMLGGAAVGIGSLATMGTGIVTGSGLAIGKSLLAGAGGIGLAVEGATPSISASMQGTNNSVRSLDGEITLIAQSSLFADSNSAEFGYPLYRTRTLSSIPGYIKCADGDNDAIGSMYIEEREQVGQHLTNGFYYE